MKKFFVDKIRIVFIVLFFLVTTYYMFIKSELYESKTSIVIKNLSTTSVSDSFGIGIFGMGSSSQTQDSMILKEYMESLDMLLILDKKFHIINHYKSKDIDFVERLKNDAPIEKALKFYQNRINIVYDETSGIIHIAYAHTNPKMAKEILQYILLKVEDKINKLNKIKAEKQLFFVTKTYEKTKKAMEQSIQKLKEFQNKHKLIDPTNNATSSNSIIATLEQKLTEKKIEYRTKTSYLNKDNYELTKLRSEIEELINSIARQKSKLSGYGNQKLNNILFNYEKLKMQLDFAIEVYKNSLLQLEKIKLEIAQKAKMLSIIIEPNMPDGYTYPNKPRVFITILLITLLFYGIFSMIFAIIKDHKE